MRVLVWRSTCIQIRGALRFQYMSTWNNELCVNTLVYASVFHHVLMCLCMCCICVHCDSPCEHFTYPLTTGKGKAWAEGRRGRVREATRPSGNQHYCFHVRIDFNNVRVEFWNKPFYSDGDFMFANQHIYCRTHIRILETRLCMWWLFVICH